MLRPQFFLAPITLLDSLPAGLPVPKFRIGQEVLWSRTPTHGFGRIIGIVFSGGVTTQQEGYHYAVQLDSRSPSSQDCAADWAFEEDLELLTTHAHLLKGIGVAQPEALL